MQKYKMKVVPFDDFIYRKCSYNVLISVVLYFKNSIFPILSNDVIVYSHDATLTSLIPVDCIQIKNDQELLHDLGFELNSFNEELINNKDKLLSEIKARVISNEPVFTPVDLFSMKSKGNWNIHYGINHFTHDVMVIGYDDILNSFIILDTNDRHCFETIINYEDLYNNYKNYLEYCIWSPRKILSLRKKQYFEEKQKHINYYTNIFKNNLLNNKKNICRSIVYLDDCCYNMNRLLSMDIIEQKQINEIYSNQYLSTNLKYVQYYQMKNFFPQDFKLINDYKIILELFDLLKSLFIKYTLTYDKSIKQNVNNYFMQLKKLEHECNRRVFKQIN